jgi:hypothetical protein
MDSAKPKAKPYQAKEPPAAAENEELAEES